MSTLNKPEIPAGSEPSPDDDPTGVRALLSSLPDPDPMPQHLVERINASLAAEQERRAARMSDTSVSPMLATARGRAVRRRPARLMFAAAGAAAAVVLLAVVGSNMFAAQQATTISSSAALSGTSSAEAKSAAPPASDGKAPAAAAARAAAPALVEIALSGTRYTPADFVTQTRALRLRTLAPIRLQAAKSSSSVGPAGTPAGLLECLSAIGANAAQASVVRADVAFYAGQPAVIIVATTDGRPVAYAVGRQCSRTDAAVIRGATPLP